MNAPDRTVIELTRRIPIEEQIEEAFKIVAEHAFYRDWRQREGAETVSYGELREAIERRLAILQTLQWLQENRAVIQATHNMLRGEQPRPHEILQPAELDDIEEL